MIPFTISLIRSLLKDYTTLLKEHDRAFECEQQETTPPEKLAQLSVSFAKKTLEKFLSRLQEVAESKRTG